MASILTCDPLLSFLGPKDLFVLGHACRETREVVKNFQATKRTYTAGKDFEPPWWQRQKLYSLYPSVQSLLFHCGPADSLKDFLRPSLKSLHLVLPLKLEQYPEESEFRWVNLEFILSELNSLQEFLHVTPDAQLTSFRISLDPTVKLIFADADRMTVDYDKWGPIFEDCDVCVKDTYGSPSGYFWVMEQDSRLESALQDLAAARTWTSLTLPADLPGASTIPSATLVDPYDMDDDALDSLWEHIDMLFMREINKWT